MTAAPYRPMNPHGQIMPGTEHIRAGNRHDRRANAKSQELYQIWVEDAEGAHYPVGPKMLRDFAERFLTVINIQISKGRELQWTNPHLVKAGPTNGETLIS